MITVMPKHIPQNKTIDIHDDGLTLSVTYFSHIHTTMLTVNSFPSCMCRRPICDQQNMQSRQAYLATTNNIVHTKLLEPMTSYLNFSLKSCTWPICHQPNMRRCQTYLETSNHIVNNALVLPNNIN